MNCCGNLDGEPIDMRKWEREDVCYTCCGNLSGNLSRKLRGKTCFHDGNGRKMMGAGTGGSLTKSGRETTGAKNMAARDGYVYVGIDFTTDSRPVPVPSRPQREFPSRFYPCKALVFGNLLISYHSLLKYSLL